jgi:4-hydroxy-3-methylbut-2-en-1-yl diphosphate reductase
MESKRKIFLAEPRGFCAGVIRAVQIVEDMLAQHGSPVYVRHEIVHNKYVVDSFRKAGVRFIENLSEVPKGETVIFSAHGVSPKVEKRARDMGLKYIDATCPLVKTIHEKAVQLKKEGYTILLIGDKNHPELVGTLGHLGDDAIVIESVEDAANFAIPEEIEKITYLTQTTLSPEDVEEITAILKERLPLLECQSKNDICYATLERQVAIKKLAEKCDTILVLGSPESSNSNRLTQAAINAGAKAYLIDSCADIPDSVFKSAGNIGVTAGASAPEILVKQTVECFRKKGFYLE